MTRPQLDHEGNTIRTCHVPFAFRHAEVQYSVTEREDGAAPIVHLHHVRLPSGMEMINHMSPIKLETVRKDCLKHYTVQQLGIVA